MRGPAQEKAQGNRHDTADQESQDDFLEGADDRVHKGGVCQEARGRGKDLGWRRKVFLAHQVA